MVHGTIFVKENIDFFLLIRGPLGLFSATYVNTAFTGKIFLAVFREWAENRS